MARAHFWKFWFCPRKLKTISKFSKIMRVIYSKNCPKQTCDYWLKMLRKFEDILPRTSLIRIYKSFARPHLGYGSIIYDQTFNEFFHKNIESIQYNAAIAITGAIRCTFSEKLYQELGLESLGSRRWLKKLCLFFKIYKNKSPSYLYKLDRVKFYSTWLTRRQGEVLFYS